MSLSRLEQETAIIFNEEEKTATIDTCNGRIIRQLKGYCEKYPELYKLEKEDEYGACFKVPKKYVSIRQPKIMTEEQKQKAGERMRLYRENLAVSDVDNVEVEEDENVG